mmetsp:Transcript_831/g.758  ORF Transcript_831/g.758 Transcript_831/m.758 type:complete len:101 (+) Transcript_831:302-604(+)
MCPITKNFNYFMAGWTVLTPTLMLFMSQNTIIFLLSIIVQLILPYYFNDIVKEKYLILSTEEGLQMLMGEKALSLILTSGLILSFHRQTTKGEIVAEKAR